MNLLFPHDKIRQYQDDFINDLVDAVSKGENLIAHAPTGTGKSAAVLSAIVPIAIEKGLTIFFVTPRHTQHRIIVDTMNLIRKKFNLDIAAVDLVGKKSLCAIEDLASFPSSEFNEYCRHQVENGECEFYNNVHEKKGATVMARNALGLIKNKCMHAEQFKEWAMQQKLCPYEMSCLAARRAIVVVADYNHVLNSYIRGGLLKKLEKGVENSIVIIDEAHNVINKTRDLLSSSLSTLTVERAKKEASTFGFEKLSKDLEKLNDVIITEATENERLMTKEEFINGVNFVADYDNLIKELRRLADAAFEKKKRSYASSISNFLSAWLGRDDPYVRIISKGVTKYGSKHVSLDYKCLDPSAVTKDLSEEVYSLVMMSGTLNPVGIYKKLYNIEAIAKEYKSPFPKKNRLTIIVPETTTKFTARSEEMFEKIAKKCVAITEAIPGNSFIFFPSYAIRNKVYTHFLNSSRTIFLEDQNMNKKDREELLQNFGTYKDTGAVLLAVSNGSFGEGIDMPGDLLKGVVIVGLPLSKPDLETQEIIKYYDKRFGNGNEYGYILPAFIKSFQNAGRCIRSETDKGVIVYLDERYAWSNYFKFFSQDEYLRIVKNPVERIKEFFEQNEDKQEET